MLRAGVAQETDVDLFLGLRLAVSDVDYDGEDVRTASVEYFMFVDFLAMSLGWAGHWDQSNAWGTGPSIGGGLFWVPSRRAALGLEFRAYLWFGSDNDEFDVGLEGDASLEVRLSF